MSQHIVDKSDCSHHVIFPGVDIFTTHGERLMLSLVEFQPLAVVEEHSRAPRRPRSLARRNRRPWRRQ